MRLTKGKKSKRFVLGAVGAALLSLTLLVAVVFKLHTKDGTLVVEVNESDATVEVFNEAGTIEITRPGEKGPITISVDPGKHRLKVEKAGFQVFTKEFEIESGGTAPIKATLEPLDDKPWLRAAFVNWEKEVAALPAEKQVEAVAKKLQELNPGFDGKLTGVYGWVPPKVENGVVKAIGYSSDAVADISPVRALTGLQSLSCFGSGPGKGKLADLSPLKGMRLASFQCHGTMVSELSPLRELPLVNLDCSLSRVSDLSPIKGMPLTVLTMSGTKVFDLSPLKGMPLTELHCDGTPLTDLSPLAGLNLAKFVFTPGSITKGLDAIRQMTSVTAIGTSWNSTLRPEDFWKKYDAGEFGKPGLGGAAAKKTLAFETPGFDQWMNDVAAMPAEKQVDAVANKLQELNPGFDGRLSGAGGNDTPKIENGVVTETWVYHGPRDGHLAGARRCPD